MAPEGRRALNFVLVLVKVALVGQVIEHALFSGRLCLADMDYE